MDKIEYSNSKVFAREATLYNIHVQYMLAIGIGLVSLVDESIFNLILNISLKIYISMSNIGGVILLHFVDVVTVGAIIGWFGYIIQKQYGRLTKEDWQRF